MIYPAAQRVIESTNLVGELAFDHKNIHVNVVEEEEFLKPADIRAVVDWLVVTVHHATGCVSPRDVPIDGRVNRQIEVIRAPGVI